ncbi:hypothetical protein Tco_1516759 [Tanacetum coccineum]
MSITSASVEPNSMNNLFGFFGGRNLVSPTLKVRIVIMSKGHLFTVNVDQALVVPQESPFLRLGEPEYTGNLEDRLFHEASLCWPLKDKARAGAGVWFFLSRINALTISFSSAISDETAGVEELVLTLETMALLRD